MKRRIEKVEIIIKRNKIVFPNGYFFKQSSVNQTKKIETKDITEINLNTYPPSLVFKSREIIFLKQELKKEIEQFARQNKVPIINRLDIWEHINRPYLDTEFEKDEKIESIRLLSENGISKLELNKIRKKVVKTMFLNFLAWEWTYLGLFDYLNWTFLTKKKYWWAMEIGLRNYKTTLV